MSIVPRRYVTMLITSITGSSGQESIIYLSPLYSCVIECCVKQQTQTYTHTNAHLHTRTRRRGDYRQLNVHFTCASNTYGVCHNVSVTDADNTACNHTLHIKMALNTMLSDAQKYNHIKIKRTMMKNVCIFRRQDTSACPLSVPPLFD